jgi:hypothetical protein
MEKEFQESMEELVVKKRQVEDVTKYGESLRRERDSLRDVNRLQEQSVNRLADKLGVAQQTVKEEEGIQWSLQAATEATSQIFKMDEQALIKKKLQVVHKGEPQPFKLLYETIQDFSNDIIAVEEALQCKVVATREYLKEKYQPAAIPKEKPADGGRIMVDLEDSDEERVPGAFFRTLGLGRQTEKIPKDQLDSLKQLVAYKPLEEKEEPEAGEMPDYIALQAGPVPKPPPTVEEIHQDSLAKYPGTLPPGPISTASGRTAFMAMPISSQLPPQGDQPALK